MRSVIILIFYIFISGSSASKSQNIDINGFVEIDHISYFKNNNSNSNINNRNQGILQLEFSSDLSEKAALYSSIEFRDDQSDPLRNRTYLDEGYIDLYFNNIDFRIGKQIIIWGKADAINPTDNINPSDFSDILDTDDERIGMLALKTNYYLGGWTFEGIISPEFKSSILPGYNSRWLPEYPQKIQNQYYPEIGSAKLNVIYKNEIPILPEDNFKKIQFAAKGGTTISGWDFSVCYYYGWDDIPTFHKTNAISNDTIYINLQPRFHKRNAVGGDFATNLGKFGIRGEAAYYFTEDNDGNDPEIDDQYFQYVLGIDRTFSNVFGENNLFLLGQWIQEISKYNTKYDPMDLRHIFQKSITVRMELEIGNYSKLIVESMYNVDSNDYYIHPVLSCNIINGTTLDVSGDFLGGDSDKFFGMYKDNKRFQVKLKYNF